LCFMVVRLKDIADRAKVSITTVSRVINGREEGVQIREETRTKILAIAAELGYRPNLMARALRGSQSFLLGVLAQNISSIFHSQILQGLNATAAARGYRVVLGHVRRNVDVAVEYSSMFEQSHADGILIIGELSGSHEAFNILSRQHRHIVVISDHLPDQKFPAVYSDSQLGTRMAMDHLWEAGHRHIVCVADSSLRDVQVRAETYMQYMREHGAEDHAQVQHTARSFQGSYETGLHFLKDLFNQPSAPTAIFAATDSIAIGLLQAAFQLGITVPDDISIIGFDDIDFAAFTVPPLTTLRQSGVSMGEIGSNLLIDMIEQKQESSNISDIVLPPSLIIRQSTSSIAAPPSSGHKP
jgi:LacI family transcriptional regulator, repressor for deo operon, udp, cdd, tsx, nupC, and nupG